MDFHETVTEFNVKNKQAIPQSAVQLIFLNIQQIYQLNENILNELQERMDSWYAPGALYVAMHRNAMQTLTTLLYMFCEWL